MHALRFALVALLMASGTALSQSGVGVAPSRSEYSVMPGGQVTGFVSVDNPSNAALAVDGFLADVFQQPDGSMLFLEGGVLPNSLGPWTAISPLRFDLAGSAHQQVAYTISVPADAVEGTYVAVIFFEPDTSQEAQEGDGSIGVSSRVRVGHIVYVHVGQATREGNISHIGYRRPPQPGEIAALTVTFQNTGSGLVRIDGLVEVRDLDGALVVSRAIDDVASLPGATHEVIFYLEDPLPSGEYVALAVFDLGEAELVMGESRITVP